MADTLSYASRLETDASLDAMLREHRTEGIANCGDHWEKARRLKKFQARDQWGGSEKAGGGTSGSASGTGAPAAGRKSPRLTIPETSRVLATFSGRQIMQRTEREYIPRNQSTARFAETWTKVDRAVMQACDGEQVDSAAFRDGPGVSGISWCRWYVDEWSGDKPQLKKVTVPIWSMMWPATREINLKDRAWQRWGSWWPQSTVRDRWVEKFAQIRVKVGSKHWSAAEQLSAHGQSSRIPWAGQAGNRPLDMSEHYNPATRALWIEYEEWRELVTYFQLVRPRDPAMTYAEALSIGVDPAAAAANPDADPMERIQVTKAELSEFKARHLAAHNEEVPAELSVRKPRMVYRYAYLCGDEILETGDLAVGCFTFNAMAAEVVELPDRTHYIGLLEDLEDAQRMVNYMMSALVRDIQINPKGVFIHEQGLFRDKGEALTSWTSPGGVIEVPRGKLTQGAPPWKIEAGGTSAYSNKLEAMLAFWREAIPRLAGFNPATLGQLGPDLRRVSGEVVRQLTDATMTSNAERIDSLRLFRREDGRIFMAFARMLWEPEDLIDFIGEEDAYDVVTDSATGEDALDPATGQPVRVLAIPPKSMWKPDAWKEIAIEEVAPTDNELAALWDTLQTQVQLLISPMADTGAPLFSSEDLVDILPKIPAARRQKMKMRIKQQIQKMKMMQAQAAAAMEQQQGLGGSGSPPAEVAPS
jgi:hypothetical protein